MSNVFIGAGRATGMAYRAPRGTALPTSPLETLGEDWEELGAVTEDGATLKLPSGETIKNWAKVSERRINSENGSVSLALMETTAQTLGAINGDDNVSEIAATTTHGKLLSTTFSPDAAAEPCAYLFIMKDGDKLGFLGSSDALVSEVSDIVFNAAGAATYGVVIEGTWTLTLDDGAVVPPSPGT